MMMIADCTKTVSCVCICICVCCVLLHSLSLLEQGSATHDDDDDVVSPMTMKHHWLIYLLLTQRTYTLWKTTQNISSLFVQATLVWVRLYRFLLNELIDTLLSRWQFIHHMLAREFTQTFVTPKSLVVCTNNNNNIINNHHGQFVSIWSGVAMVDRRRRRMNKPSRDGQRWWWLRMMMVGWLVMAATASV